MSRRITSALRMILAATVVSALPVSLTQAADLIAPGAYTAAPDSDCAAPGRLASIERDFRHQAREVHHMPNLQIVSISNIRENRYLPIQEDFRAVERLYCRARAALSDGRSRDLWYLIEYGEGFAGAFGDNVEFCVTGLDRWNAYDGYCRVLR